ncbi:helix-turn-helix domain-containing protein [Flexivirga oryzae]|uniref:DNA-binding MarR family transcriptional regulator n=1 Tax=Flexivirga oryzae TaxID=1794944 RepID=A0A839NHT4_9MICO|nr:DNA-binding MarR family transcriptional regulator [Flexivirga oryzae]
MITVDLAPRMSSTIRWAPSPVLETLGWLCLTRDGGTDPTYGAPDERARELLDCPDVALVAELLPHGDGPTPDFLVPVPADGPAAAVATAQLDEIRRTDHAIAAVQVWEDLGDRELSTNVSCALRDGTLPARAARGLKSFWENGVAGIWPTAQEALQAEIERCTQLVESGGISAALGAVHDRLSYDDLLQLSSDGPAPETPSELLVIPTALYGPTRLAMRLWGTQPFVAYPVGVAATRSASLAELRRLLGPTRALILRKLTSARTTTELSGELRLAAATVSYHVKVLQRAGLLERSRDRHSVLYELSPTGRQLLTGTP